MRLSVLTTAVFFALTGLAGADQVRAAIRKPINIPAQQLTAALQELAQERNFQLVFVAEDLDGIRTAGAVGDYTAEEALRKLLTGTDLSFKYLDENTVTIVSPAATQSDTTGDTVGGNFPPGRLRVAEVQQHTSFAAEVADTGGDRSSASAASPEGQLAEIVVTAQKKLESIQDVPVPVTAIDAGNLVATNQLRIQDYYTQVPGFSYTASGAQSVQMLAIRGISTSSSTNPTVGITVDDVPYGASTSTGGGSLIPDIDPGDLARVEVLRGPQGTLYGADSIGGLLKFVTVDPSTQAVSGQVQAGTSGVYNGAEPGYNFRASVNVPLGDSLAIRASAFNRQDPGYIDNPDLGIRGINEDHASGGRLAAMWWPTDGISLKLSALYQQIQADGNADVDVLPGLGGLQQDYLPGLGGYERKVEAYSATLKVKLGSVDLTSVTGYNINSYRDSWDYTDALGPLTQAQFGVPGTPVTDDNSTRKLSQEVRLSGSVNSAFDWLVGGFYTREYSTFDQNILAESPGGTLVGTWLNYTGPSTYQEYAAFADLTYHFTERFDVQLGGRQSHIETVDKPEVEVGVFDTAIQGQASPVVTPEAVEKGNPFTYLLTPRFKITPDLMVYARLASGYRPGGPNVGNAFLLPAPFGPDKTQNYEVGFKGDFLQRTLSVDASVYYIDWKDIQLSLVSPQTGLGYTANAGSAKSQGAELSAESRPLTGLTISGWVSFDDAVLTEGLPASSPSYGVAGERLPYSSRFSGNLSLQQDFPLWSRWNGFAGGTVSYIGERIGEFTASPQRQIYPDYTQVNLRAGVKDDAWSVNLYVNNLTDKRALLGGGPGTNIAYAYTYIQPRTIGISLGRSF